MTQVALPSAARDRLLERFGPGTAAWLDGFGARVGELCRQWELEPGPVHAGGTGAVVQCRSTRDGSRYGLKLTPDRTVAGQEGAALTYWAEAPAVVDLVAADPGRGALLLEWLPDATVLGGWQVRELAALIADLYPDGQHSRRGAPPATVPSASERLDTVFDLWDRRRRALPRRRSTTPTGPGAATRPWRWPATGPRCCMAISMRATSSGQVRAGDWSPLTRGRASAIRRWTWPTWR